MGNGNIDVGNAPATRKPGQPALQDSSGSSGSELRIDDSVKTGSQGGRSATGAAHPASVSGAMSQQGGEFRGNVSAPQQFVHLVGCRDRKPGPGRATSQYPDRVKR